MRKTSRGARGSPRASAAGASTPRRMQGVAEQHAEGGDRIQQQAAQQVGIGEHARRPSGAGAAVWRADRAPPARGRTNRPRPGRRSRPCRTAGGAGACMSWNSMAKQSVEVGHFVLGQQQRRRAALLAPPAEDVLAGGQFARREISLSTQSTLIVGELGVVVAGGGRAVEHHRDQALAVGLLELLHELRAAACP